MDNHPGSPSRQASRSRAAVVVALVASAGWVVYSIAVLLLNGWAGALVAAFLIPFSGLVVALAWPQFNRADPARRSTLIVIFSMVGLVGLLVSYPMLTDNDDVFSGLLAWIGPAAVGTAGVPLVMLLWGNRRTGER